MDYRALSHVWSQDQLARTLGGNRSAWMPQGPVFEALETRPGDVVLDVGAGLGWLSMPLAQWVGPEGQVWAVDPSEEAVEALALEASNQSLPQLHALEAYAESLPIPSASVDRVVWHTVALHMGDRVQAMAETFRVLKPGGRFVVVDWRLIPTPSGPPLERRVSQEMIEPEALAAGFHLHARFEPGPVTWGLVFERPS